MLLQPCDLDNQDRLVPIIAADTKRSFPGSKTNVLFLLSSDGAVFVEDMFGSSLHGFRESGRVRHTVQMI